MRRQFLVGWFAAIALGSCGTDLRADVITSLSATFAPTSANTFDQGPFIGFSLAEPTLTYNDISPIDVFVTVDSSGTYQLAEGSVAGGAINQTALAWIGFRSDFISLPEDVTASFVAASIFDATGDLTLTRVKNGGLTTTLSQGTGVPVGSTDKPQLVFQVSAAGTYDIRETPLFTPEPSSLVLLAFGALGLLMAARRRV